MKNSVLILCLAFLKLSSAQVFCDFSDLSDLVGWPNSGNFVICEDENKRVQLTLNGTDTPICASNEACAYTYYSLDATHYDIQSLHFCLDMDYLKTCEGAFRSGSYSGMIYSANAQKDVMSLFVLFAFYLSIF